LLGIFLIGGDSRKALIVIDAQNEFSEAGCRPVPGHDKILSRIRWRIQRARKNKEPIAWVQHHNKPHESPAFIPGSWGAELSSGLGPKSESRFEKLFQKDVFGAFFGTGLEDWLHAMNVDELLLVGFFAHMCLSTSTREALVRGFSVAIDPEATGARDLAHPLLGRQTADEVRRTALLQLSDMGAEILEVSHGDSERAIALEVREQ
jgi:nicotinamidase-related amidase